MDTMWPSLTVTWVDEGSLDEDSSPITSRWFASGAVEVETSRWERSKAAHDEESEEGLLRKR